VASRPARLTGPNKKGNQMRVHSLPAAYRIAAGLLCRTCLRDSLDLPDRDFYDDLDLSSVLDAPVESVYPDERPDHGQPPHCANCDALLPLDWSGGAINHAMRKIKDVVVYELAPASERMDDWALRLLDFDLDEREVELIGTYRRRRSLGFL